MVPLNRRTPSAKPMMKKRNRRLRAGVDIALIGSDNVAASAYCNPPLTTLALDPEHLGEVASELLARLKSPDAPPMKFLLKPKLIVRETCGSKRSGI
jgi:LacI family transcriptional regulator